jgi:succinylglutamate desuccinylase
MEVNNVFVVGGTHGNELHGIYLVNEINTALKSEEMRCNFPSLSISGVIANIDAMKSIGTGAGRRYCDTDLNRCFLTKDLDDSSISTIEGLRAKELNMQLGPKLSKAPKADFILDYHSTTSNTGVLLLCHPQDKFSQQIIAYLQSLHSSVSGCLWSDSESSLLPSVGRSGMTVEVGPIAHSTSNSSLYQFTKTILNDILVYMEKYNTHIRASTHVLKSSKLILYKLFATVGFPRNSLGNNWALCSF